MDQTISNVHQDNQRFNPSSSRAREMPEARDGVQPNEKKEGEVTKQIENVTSEIPSGAFLTFAISAIGVSALLHLSGKKEDAQFIGQWVPTALILGLYNKMVKLNGSD